MESILGILKGAVVCAVSVIILYGVFSYFGRARTKPKKQDQKLIKRLLTGYFWTNRIIPLLCGISALYLAYAMYSNKPPIYTLENGTRVLTYGVVDLFFPVLLAVLSFREAFNIKSENEKKIILLQAKVEKLEAKIKTK